MHRTVRAIALILSASLLPATLAAQSPVSGGSLVATIGGEQELYTIQVDTITSASVIGSDLIVETVPSTITIGCIDPRDAARNLAYLEEVRAANDLETTMANRPRYRVTAGSSIQSAIDNAFSGDVLEIDPGTYNGALVLKDGVDLVFSDSGSTIVSASGAPTLTLAQDASVHIYGRASFRTESADEYTPVVLNELGANGSLFLQFAALVHEQGRVVTWQSGKLYLLGDNISNSAGNLSPFDWDASADVIDVDVAAIDSANEGIFITYQDNPSGDVYVRNAHITSRTATIQSSGNSIMPRLALVSVEMAASSQSFGSIDLTMDDLPIEIHMWNVTMASGPTSPFSIFGPGDINLTLHTEVVADKGFGPTVKVDGIENLVAPFVNLGGSKAGTGNQSPILVGWGPMTAGSVNKLNLINAKSNSGSYLFYGFSLGNVPFKGGVMVPGDFEVVKTILPIGPAGSSSLSYKWPSGAAGASVYLQHWILDAGAVSGVSASNGLKVTGQP